MSTINQSTEHLRAELAAIPLTVHHWKQIEHGGTGDWRLSRRLDEITTALEIRDGKHDRELIYASHSISIAAHGDELDARRAILGIPKPVFVGLPQRPVIAGPESLSSDYAGA